MTETGTGEIGADVPESWAQGRTTFGGLTAALCAATARRTHADLPPLRSMQMSFLQPLGDAIRLRAALLRRGRSASFVRVTADAGGGPAAAANLVFGAARASRHTFDRAPLPDLPPPEACPPLDPGGALPRFTRHFDMRRAAGAAILSASADPDLTVWTRLRSPGDVDAEAALVCTADSLPPAALAAFAEARPVSTITWSLEVARLPAPGDWILVTSETRAAGEGYALQAMTLHDAGGVLLATASQLVALFE